MSNVPTTSRPLLSSIEKDILNNFTKILTTTESQFCCGGTIKLPADQKLSLLYKVDGNGQARSLELPSEQNDPGVQQLFDACKPSPHGHGNETVYDESYRLARELLKGCFALTEDILNENDVLATIAALTAPRNPGDGIVACLYKLNAYAVGGFFKAHRDTPKSDRHIGTLVVTLPVPFEGGALRISHEERQVLFDWSKDINPSSSSSEVHDIKLPWAFLFSDVEHEVLPVTAGTRVTLAYDIFTSDKLMLASSPSVDGTTLPLYPDVKAVLENHEFLPGGGRVAVALSHLYPIHARTSSEAFASHLKGSDAALYCALSTLRVPVSLCAVFSPEDAIDLYESEEKFPGDGYGPSRIIPGNEDERTGARFEVLYTSEKLGGHGGDYWEEGEMKFLESVCKANLDVDLIWARKPKKEEYSESGHFIHYGNEASLGYVYSAAAFVLEIPPLGHIARWSH